MVEHTQDIKSMKLQQDQKMFYKNDRARLWQKKVTLKNTHKQVVHKVLNTFKILMSQKLHKDRNFKFSTVCYTTIKFFLQVILLLNQARIRNF